jgi:hypothetical protein
MIFFRPRWDLIRWVQKKSRTSGIMVNQTVFSTSLHSSPLPVAPMLCCSHIKKDKVVNSHMSTAAASIHPCSSAFRPIEREVHMEFGRVLSPLSLHAGSSPLYAHWWPCLPACFACSLASSLRSLRSWCLQPAAAASCWRAPPCTGGSRSARSPW